MDIPTALASLDPLDDTHWTTDGAPRLEVLTAKLGFAVTRQQARAAAPEFSRERPTVPGAVAPAPTAAPVAPAPAPAPTPATTGADLDADKLEDEPEPAVDGAEPAKSQERPELARLRVVDAEIAELNQARGDIDARLQKLTVEQATLQRFADAQRDPHADQKARMAFIESEQKNRAANAERRARLADLANLPGVAPIDRAMARRTARGGQRPAFPVLVPPAGS
jgi:hypothetical protein